MTPAIADISLRILRLAEEMGFSRCGFAPVNLPEQDNLRLHEWLHEGMHASMHYMENHVALRTDPSHLMPGAKSVIMVLLSYPGSQGILQNDNLKIARYARGRDYHKVMKAMLRKFQQHIEAEVTPMEGRICVDSAPVPERSLAALAGLGWIGKNANLISPELGSYVFIGEIFTNLELSYGTTLSGRCGTCTSCIEACPTGAIVKPGTVDSRRCISYWTIEHKGEINEELRGKFGDWIFGCDICQEVCPWNRKTKNGGTGESWLTSGHYPVNRNEWQSLTEERFRELFSGTPVMRAKYEGLLRNIRFVSGS